MKSSKEIATLIMEMDSTDLLVLEKMVGNGLELSQFSDQYPMYDLAHMIFKESSDFDKEEYIAETAYDVEDPMAENTNPCGRAIGEYIINLHEQEIYEAMHIIEAYQIQGLQEIMDAARRWKR